MSANLHAFATTTNRAAATGRIQDYFAHRFGVSSLPKYTWHLTWQGGDHPKLHHLADIAKRISNRIEYSVEKSRIKPHQCSLFSRSLLGVMATSFPGYVTGPPESVGGLRRHLYSWFDPCKPNDEVLSITRNVLRELSEYSRSQVLSRPATNLDARCASNPHMEANGGPIGGILVHTAIYKLSFMRI